MQCPCNYKGFTVQGHEFIIIHLRWKYTQISKLVGRNHWKSSFLQSEQLQTYTNKHPPELLPQRFINMHCPKLGVMLTPCPSFGDMYGAGQGRKWQVSRDRLWLLMSSFVLSLHQCDGFSLQLGSLLRSIPFKNIRLPASIPYFCLSVLKKTKNSCVTSWFLCSVYKPKALLSNNFFYEGF